MVNNPWRVFIENVINGSNYFRTSEYYDLLADLDRLYEIEEKYKNERTVCERGESLSGSEAID